MKFDRMLLHGGYPADSEGSMLPPIHKAIQRTHYAGVYNDMIRLSAGLESIEDLKENFAQAIL